MKILCLIVLFFNSIDGKNSITHLNNDFSQITPLEISALSRVAQLGELYDARTDQFIRISMIKSSFPNTSIESTQNKETKLVYGITSSLSQKFTTLDVSANLKMSVMGGLFELKGSGKFFKDTKRSAKSAKASLVESLLTTYEQVSITDKNIKPIIDHDVLAQIDATHVVVGIQWGGNVFISVEDTNEKNEDQQVIEGNLGVAMKWLAMSISGEGNVNISEEEMQKLSKFNFELYGDLVPTEAPQTLIEALQFMKKAPGWLQEGNGGKGKPMKYTLLPLETLRKLWQIESEVTAILKNVDETTVKKCVRLFDDIDKVAQKLYDVVDDVNNLQQYMPSTKVREVNDIVHKYEDYHDEVRRNLSEKLIKFRAGEEDITKLQQVMIDASQHPYLWQNMNKESFTLIKKEVNFIKLLFDTQIKLLDKYTSLKEFSWRNFGKDIYVLFFNYASEIMDDNKLSLFRRMVDNHGNYGPKAMFITVRYDLLFDEVYGKSNMITFETKGMTRINNTNKISMIRNDTVIIDDYQEGQDIPEDTDPNHWTLYQIQQNVMTLQHLTAQQHAQVEAKITNLERNPVPIGFVYVELPGQPWPGDIWPGTQWECISGHYSGLFFRVEGAEAAPFGDEQGASTRERFINDIGNVESGAHLDQESENACPGCPRIPENGWGKWVWTGKAGGDYVFIRFHSVTANNEIRPRNKAMRLWKRIA